MTRSRVKGREYALLHSFIGIIVTAALTITTFNFIIPKQTRQQIDNTKVSSAFNFVNFDGRASNGEFDKNRIVFLDTDDATAATKSTEAKPKKNSVEKTLMEHHDINRKYMTLHSCNSHCLSSMGKNGDWVQDWNFARNYGQFPLPWVIPPKPLMANHELKFQPTLESPFPWRTSWKWIDKEAKCQMDPMTTEIVCSILDEFDVDRIAFYGDSLTESQFHSFVNMMGPENTRKKKPITDRDDVTNEFELVCRRKKSGQKDKIDNAFIIPLFFQRPVGEAAHKQFESAYNFSEKLNSFINQSEKRILIVFNIGAHYHNETLYQEDLSKMLDLISAFDRHQDLYFFRTTSPGHAYCEPRKPWDMDWMKGVETKPFSKIEEMRWDNVVARRWNWEKFQHYNKHTKDIIEEKHQAGEIPMVHVIDVYNMTALRCDGHRGGTDCLHYAYPGPIDWWNHFLFAYLKELSRVLRRENMVNCRL